MRNSTLPSLAVAAATAALALGFGPAPRKGPTPQDFLALNRAACGGQEPGALRRALLTGAAAYAQAAAPGGAPALMAGLGDESYPVSTQNPMAQAYFDQGLALTFGFNHAAAVASFREAQRLDPACAMCFWGQAFALGPNINAPMAREAYAPAHAAARKALELAGGAAPAERALIEAVQTRYTATAPEDRAALDKAFAEAMRKAADAYAGDDLIQVLAVEAMMDTQPWAYWQADGRTPNGYTADMLARLERVLARAPEHEGAIHLYIHVTEASRDPWRAAKAAERLDAMQLTAGHLQHMPAHIYFRVGRFRDSIAANLKAVAADEAYMAAQPDDGLYRFGYYPHNVHFVLTSAQRGGDGRLALAYAEKLDQVLPMEMATAAPWVIPVKAAPWFAKADFAAPEALLAEAGPGEGHPFLQAAWRYARGMAQDRLGNTAAAQAEAQEIARLAKAEPIAAMDAQGVPASTVLALAQKLIAGRAAMTEGDRARAIAAFEEAVELHAGLAYTEPPWWPYPVRRTLAAALLLDGQAERAEQEFLQTLIEAPSDAYAYWGLAQARAAQGDARGRRAAMGFFKGAWLGGRERPELTRL